MRDLRTNRRQLLQRAGALGALGALLTPATAFAENANDVAGPEGSWLSTVTILGPGAPPPFLALATYAEGGRYVETDQSQLMPPFIGTPGHGTWVRTAERQFAVTFLSLSSDAKGTPQGMSKVRQVVTLQEDGDTYRGSGKFEVFDVHGKAILSGSFTTQGKRIRAEPF